MFVHTVITSCITC